MPFCVFLPRHLAHGHLKSQISTAEDHLDGVRHTSIPDACHPANPASSKTPCAVAHPTTTKSGGWIPLTASIAHVLSSNHLKPTSAAEARRRSVLVIVQCRPLSSRT
ncbi:hypothetical protein CIHG_08844 [Coccidioides immitis H538.4]|uniref:Uncharacterized protein n=2 Tax=Coccidioides immitis TaxID=5501 RepID=A0A0J8S3Q8_COCIT|nr:hypothetical protein CIRG_04739 [Coccidioides immitis RMSCC 2394]KMU90989.1 hypothetical protein CIHG_08844 [Coccidioides immitis H538.4]